MPDAESRRFASDDFTVRRCPGGIITGYWPDLHDRVGVFVLARPAIDKAAGIRHLMTGSSLSRGFPAMTGYQSSPLPRRRSVGVDVGGIMVGGDAPVVVQSMTNTDTADVDGTVAQVAALAKAGSEIVRITVDRDESAAAVAGIRERLDRLGITVPLVGDFHYIGHKLLADYPACAEALAKYRINPGNVGFKEKKDRQFAAIIEMAIRYDKPVRIGVNWGSLDQELLTALMDENQARRRAAHRRRGDARGDRALRAAVGAKRPKRSACRAAGSSCRPRSAACRISSPSTPNSPARCDHALHLGLTEAGMGSKGIVASSAAMGILLQQGIGDTIRISLTPEPNGDRTREVQVAQELLQTMGFRQFVPVVAACPGCGRTTSTVFQELAQNIQADLRKNMPVWRDKYPGVEELKVAVMGCIVNGPGESKHADIGISLPGTGETPTAPVFIDGRKAATLRGPNIAEEFERMVADYIEARFGQSGRQAAE